VIKTFYTDGVQIRQLLANCSGDDRALDIAARLNDFGLSICNRQKDFETLSAIIPEHLWRGAWRVEEWFLVFHGRMEGVLPETVEDPHRRKQMPRKLRLPNMKHLLALLGDIEAGESISVICRKHRVSYYRVTRLLAARRAKVAAPAHEPADKFVQFVATIREKCPELGKRLFDGQVSQQVDTAFIATCLEMFYKDAESAVQSHAAFNLARALDCTRRTQAAEWMH
jgi:hypothetical protein